MDRFPSSESRPGMFRCRYQSPCDSDSRPHAKRIDTMPILLPIDSLVMFVR